MNANLKTAIQGCKNVTPNQVWIGFEYVNDDGIRIKQRQVRLCRLYKDWYGECALCPSNDTEIISVRMRTDITRMKFDVTDTGLKIGDFMDELEKNWKFQRVTRDYE